jgi:predicted phosphodiesterase
MAKKNLEDNINSTDETEMDRYKRLYDQVVTSEEYQVASYLKKKGIHKKEVELLTKAIESGNPTSAKSYSIGKNHVKYLCISDTHIGSTQYDSGLMSHAAKVAKDLDVDFVIHVGDVVDGWYQNRPQQIFEMDAIGVDQQLEKAVKELSKFDKPLYFITANHEYNTYMRSAGVEIGFLIEAALKEKGHKSYFLGNGEGYITLKSGTKLELLHPDGGSSYAISYKSQKIAESIEGGHKPNILHIGHFHKAEYLFYRNIHILQSGTLQGQTKFMKGSSLSAHKGFWVVDLYGNTKGQVDSFSPTFYPSYD